VTLRVAIVGCGKIADDHAREIVRTPNAELVGFCDAELLMAKQMHDRFGQVPYFDDIDRLFADARPHVVHITTPPQSHYDLARRCLDANCHVYVEKPFTVDAREAAAVLRLAEARGLKVTVGHNYTFTGPTCQMRSLVQSGFLGGPPVHLESYYGYNLGDAKYARAFLGDKSHWLRRLPGGLLHNIISHGICRLAEFMTSESPIVIAHGFRSSLLEELGEKEMCDELRVIIRDHFMTAYFTFSTQIRPQMSQLRVYGTRNALVVDDHQNTLIRLGGTKYKSYLENFLPPAVMASQYLGNAASNVRDFVNHRLNMTAGLRALIQRFYQSIAADTPPPIPYREILLTSVIMDEIFAQVSEGSTRLVQSIAR
jgi:predicted dehydrogenase